ncbi:unnamed protein product [Didymodactylos carnosus]|uniref:Non-structural maintenance of chromosomes element 1 homolog n=1 Tax=Didymodactylos carnosus TaxID=1234261 RepID=A0A813NWB9_9BILA|nr:unnamed protein product [Didymodactylos carnosus]CAF0775422.1 unnamed protein product [Didymodactylos carnosus]CAF3517996.1 unnamed protein product [Didymodactylos carnosus]CAF3556569.1 unnamed protein product [Didymodactylos carnosus]
MVLNETLQQLVQYFLHHGALSEQELIELLESLRDRYDLKIKANDEIKIFTNQYLPKINENINPYGFDIKCVHSEEYENDVYYCCVQNLKPIFAKMDVSYTEKEAAIFEKMLELILLNDSHSTTTREIFEAVLGNGLKITKNDFNDVITRFRKEKWIESGRGRDADNLIILHIRAITEMSSFITDTYKDEVYACKLCSRLLLRGLRCPNCSCFLHRSCGVKYFKNLSMQKSKMSCPSCKQEWDQLILNDLDDEPEKENDQPRSSSLKRQSTTVATTSSRTSATTSSRARSTRRIVSDEDENDENNGF